MEIKMLDYLLYLLSNQDGNVSLGEGDSEANDGQDNGEDESTDESSEENASDENKDNEESAESDKSEEGILEQEDENGNKITYVRQDNIQSRIDKLVKERETYKEQLESLQSRSDTDSLRQELEELKKGLARGSDQSASSRETRTQAFLSTLKDKSASDYTSGLVQAMGQDFSVALDAMKAEIHKEMEEKYGGMVSYIGGQEIDKFLSKNPEMVPYKSKAFEYQKKYDVPLEDAFGIVSRKGMLEAAQRKAAKDEQAKAKKKNSVPNRAGSGGRETFGKAKTASEAAERAARKTGWL
jgi:hypothetical protein